MTMPVPTVTALGGLFVLEYGGEYGLRFSVDHIHAESRSGEVHAEIRVHSTLTGVVGLIHQGRVQLTGTTSRRTLAKHLSERTPGQDVDWPGVIEQVAVKVLAMFRMGEPAVLLRDVDDTSDTTTFLLPPIILDRLPTIWFGDGGTSKSMLALAAALSIQSGGAVMGITPEATRRVAFLDWEMEGKDHKIRMRALLNGTHDENTLLYVPCRTAIWDDIDRLRGIVADHAIQFVVVDSVGMACGGLPLTAEDSAIRFYTALRGLAVGALCIAHKTKAEDGDQYPFGSSYWHNQARATWYVKKDQELASNQMHVALHQRKANTTMKHAPVAFQIDFGEGSIAIAQQEFGSIEGFKDDRSLTARIVDLLRDGPMPAHQIVEELDAKKDSVYKALRRGKKLGMFVELKQGDPPIMVWANAARP